MYMQSHLECKLAELYGQLIQLKGSLETGPPNLSRTKRLLQPIKDHCCDHVTKSCKLIGECCHDLLCLSLLLPTAPWVRRCGVWLPCQHVRIL